MQRNTHTVFFHLNPKNKTNVNECNKTGTETDRYREHTSSYQRGKGMAKGPGETGDSGGEGGSKEVDGLGEIGIL